MVNLLSVLETAAICAAASGRRCGRPVDRIILIPITNLTAGARAARTCCASGHGPHRRAVPGHRRGQDGKLPGWPMQAVHPADFEDAIFGGYPNDAGELPARRFLR